MAEWISDFEHVDFTMEEKEVSEQIRRAAVQLGHTLNILLPDCRERSLARTKLEECAMWANKAIAQKRSHD